ncbi:Phosphoribosylformylglycinamidine cyclo-ligase, chloroplastic/mitochondrial [Asimina triloba]
MDSWEIPAVFKWIQEAGGIEDAEMRRTFNMGIGMVLVVSPEAADIMLTALVRSRVAKVQPMHDMKNEA